MSERRKSYFVKEANPNQSIIQYFNDNQSRGKRNSVNLFGSCFNKPASQQSSFDIKKRNTIQLTNQDIDIISEKIDQSIFLQSNVDLNNFITTGSIHNPKKMIKLSITNSPNKLGILITERNNSKRTTTKKATGSIPLILPRKTYKNSKDLFSQTLNCKLKHRSEITNQLLLNTQIRILQKKKTKKKTGENIPIFNDTVNLNKYIINQYHIVNDNCNTYSKRKQKITEETFSVIHQRKMTEIKKRNKIALMMTLENTEHNNYANESNDSSFNNYKENDVKDLKRQYYQNKKEERFKLANTFLRKLEDLSNIEYQQLDRNNLINYKNLSRVMCLMKIKEASQNNCINKRKKKLHEDEARVILATSKLGPPLYAKTKLKKDTHAKFLGLEGSYFGYPV